MAAAAASARSTGHRRFPADIEAEILAWLPVKTLKRFETACKSWSSLISSPQFAKQHYRRAQTKPPLLLTLQSDENIDFKPHPDFIVGRFAAYTDHYEGSFMANIKKVAKNIPQEDYDADKLLLRFSSYKTTPESKLAAVRRFVKTLAQPLFDGSMFGKPYMLSCRGLVCLASWSIANPPILICNPATQELISLPPTNEPNLRVGFGYAASSGEFKVVRFYNEGMKKKSRCQVFTLGTGRWRKAGLLPYRACDGTAPFLHGAVHCLPETAKIGAQKTDVISAFDIETEQYREAIPLPQSYHSFGDCSKRHGIVDPKNFMRLSVLGGSLCLAFDFGELKCYLQLWLLKDYKNVEWIKSYTISVAFIYPYPSFSFWAYPTDNMVDKTVLLNCSDEQGMKLLGFDPRRKVVTVKRDMEWGATYYEETLYSLRRLEDKK